MKTVNVGLVGYGMAGRVFHAPLIHHIQGFNLITIRETKEQNIKIAREKYPNAEIVDDTIRILNNPKVDLVVVAVPNHLHFEIARDVLNAGKHVMVDKPFTVTTKEADELIALAKEKKKIITVFQNRRWDSDFLTVQEVLKEGKLGRLVEFESHYDRFRNTIRPYTWKEEGSLGTGMLYDLGSHLIDQALLLFGLPQAVFADIRVLRDNSKIPDNFEVLLYYPSLKVTLKSSMLVKEPSPKYILYGTEGSFIKRGLDVQEADLNEGKKPLTDKYWGSEPVYQWGMLNTEIDEVEFRGAIMSQRGNYPAIYQNVYEAIANGAELEVKPEQARNTIRIIELAMESSKQRRVIDFTEV